MDFATYWQYTDFITKALFFILFTLSILSWITGLIRLYQSYRLSQTVTADMQASVQSQEAVVQLLSPIERKTITEQRLIQRIGRYRYQGEKGLAILGTTAAIAPFIGLFGTVWGIFHALHNIGATGQAGLSQVAGPVGEALIMTGLGLAVAIPAVIFYNLAMRLNRKTLYLANDVAFGLLGQSVESTKITNQHNQTAPSNPSTDKVDFSEPQFISSSTRG